VGDDYFVGQFKPDEVPINSTCPGKLPRARLPRNPPRPERFSGAPPTSRPRQRLVQTRRAPLTAPQRSKPPPRPNAGTPEVRPPGAVEPRPGGGAPEAVAAESTLGRVARVGGGGLAAGLGVVQAAHGVEELRNGNTLDGVTDTTGGVLNAAGGVAFAAGSTVAAPLALAGAAGLDAGRAIIHDQWEPCSASEEPPFTEPPASTKIARPSATRSPTCPRRERLGRFLVLIGGRRRKQSHPTSGSFSARK